MHRSNNLIGHNHLFQNLIELYNKGKLPNRILLSGEKGIGKFIFSNHFINYILSQDEENKYDLKNFVVNKNNKSFILFNNNIHPNILLIKKKKERSNIDILQIREMIHFQNNSSFNNKNKFIIIDNVADLNLNSTNALLKSIEQPNNNVFYILTYNSGELIQDTLKSRCIEFKMHLNIPSVQLIVNNYFNEKIYDTLSIDLTNYYINPSFIIFLINYLNENSLDYKNVKIENILMLVIKNKDYVKNKFINDNINLLIELFFYKKIQYANNINFKLKKYFYIKLNQIKKYNLDMESFFLEFKQRLLSE
tara:strand:- start:1186 stop:2106 length:921 start_codon:yes stop_codon:yes gene_type:complete